MNRLPQRTSLDAVCFKSAQELARIDPEPILIDKRSVQPEGRLSPIGFWHRTQARNLLEAFGVAARNPSFRFEVRVELFELCNAHRGLDVCQPVVVSDPRGHVFERIVFRLRREMFCLACKLVVLGDDHAAAAGCEKLVAVEAEARDVAKTSDANALILCAETLGGVFDYGEVVLASELENRIHVDRVAEYVNRE